MLTLKADTIFGITFIISIFDSAFSQVFHTIWLMLMLNADAPSASVQFCTENEKSESYIVEIWVFVLVTAHLNLFV